MEAKFKIEVFDEHHNIKEAQTQIEKVLEQYKDAFSDFNQETINQSLAKKKERELANERKVLEKVKECRKNIEKTLQATADQFKDVVRLEASGMGRFCDGIIKSKQIIGINPYEQVIGKVIFPNFEALKGRSKEELAELRLTHSESYFPNIVSLCFTLSDG
jgi:predicted RNase H-like nuclease (RuvC/YqgF family)